jgi:electron transfer flavoprotein alpha subunit
MSILLLVDHDNTKVSDQTAKALTAAAHLGDAVHLLVCGKDIGAVATNAATLSGASKVLVVDDNALAHDLAEPIADVIVALSGDYSAIVSAATSTGKSVLPRVAAALDVQQVSEVIEVVTPDTFKHPIYAGNAIETVQSTDFLKVITVRASAFPSSPRGNAAEIVSVAAQPGQSKSAFVSEEIAVSDRPELASAKIVVSGGRALASSENFNAYIVPLADKLGAAVGASRAAVDAGYAANDLQVGQTGKIVAPQIYIACGISGAIQHLAGMKDSKTIIAINKDPEAPIFQVADYGLVADLFEVIPQLKDAI